MRFDEWKGCAGLVSENVDGHVELGPVRQEHLKTRILIAQKRLTLNIAFVSHDGRRRFESVYRLIWLLENKDFRSRARALDLNVLARRQINIIALVEPMFFVIYKNAERALEGINKILIAAKKRAPIAGEIRTLQTAFSHPGK